MFSTTLSRRGLLRFSPLARIGIALVSLVSLLAFTWPLYLPESAFGLAMTQDRYWVFFLVIPLASILTVEAVRSVKGWASGDEGPS